MKYYYFNPGTRDFHIFDLDSKEEEADDAIDSEEAAAPANAEAPVPPTEGGPEAAPAPAESRQ